MKRLLLIPLLFLISCSSNVEPDTGVSGRWQGNITESDFLDVNVYMHLESVSGASSFGIGDIEYHYKLTDTYTVISAEYWAYGSDVNLDIHIQPGQPLYNARWTLGGRIVESGALCLVWQRDTSQTFCLQPVDTPPFR